MNFEGDDAINTEQDISLVLAKNDIYGIAAGVEQICRNYARNVIETTTRVMIWTDHMTGRKHNNSFGVGHMNGATEIDILSEVLKPNFDFCAGINRDFTLPFWGRDSHIRDADVLVPWSASRVAPFHRASSTRDAG